jgi:hypothetical protein
MEDTNPPLSRTHVPQMEEKQKQDAKSKVADAGFDWGTALALVRGGKATFGDILDLDGESLKNYLNTASGQRAGSSSLSHISQPKTSDLRPAAICPAADRCTDVSAVVFNDFRSPRHNHTSTRYLVREHPIIC